MTTEPFLGHRRTSFPLNCQHWLGFGRLNDCQTEAWRKLGVFLAQIPLGARGERTVGAHWLVEVRLVVGFDILQRENLTEVVRIWRLR